MKVCTDACAFGAWVNVCIKDFPVRYALDVGSGTGLLSLMLAQENSFNIHAVEKDHNAFKQSVENFVNSAWENRLSAHHTDVLNWTPSYPFQFIICNPPFFKNDLPSKDIMKRNALHEDGLTLNKLFSLSGKWLDKTGFIALLMPFHRIAEAIAAANENEFFLLRSAILKRNSRDEGFRGMMIFGRQQNPQVAQEQLVIRNNDNEYAEPFIDLLKPYYLNL